MFGFAILACGKTDNTAGTRVGTETTVSYTLSNPDSGFSLSGVAAARSISYQSPTIASYLEQVSELGESWESISVFDSSGGELSIPDETLFNLDFYSSDSVYGLWLDSLDIGQFPESPELVRTLLLKVLVSFRPQPGRNLFVGFAGRDQIAQLFPDSAVTLGYVPMGERPVQMWEVLNDSLGNIISVKEYSTVLQNLVSNQIGLDGAPDLILQLPEPQQLNSAPTEWVARPD